MLHQGIAPFKTAIGKVYKSREEVRSGRQNKLATHHKITREQFKTLEDDPREEDDNQRMVNNDGVRTLHNESHREEKSAEDFDDSWVRSRQRWRATSDDQIKETTKGQHNTGEALMGG